MVQCNISLYVTNDNVELADTIINKLDNANIPYEKYDNGEEICIDCLVNIAEDVPHFEVIDLQLNDYLDTVLEDDIVSWDYHFIIGIDNDFSWEP